MTSTTSWRYTIAFFFVVYLLILTKLIIFKYPIDPTTTNFLLSFGNGNYVPFKTIFGYLSGEPTWHIAIRNLLGNLLLFVPFGIFLSLIFQVINWKRVFVSALIFSILLETLQIFFIGTPDIDDVLLNTLGAIIGFFICTRIVSLLKRSNGTYS